LRTILYELRRLSTTLQTLPPRLERAIPFLKTDAQLNVAAPALRAIVNDAISTIEAKRLDRLTKRPVSPIKIEGIRAAMEAAILKPAVRDFLYFRAVPVRVERPRAPVEPFILDFNRMRKAQFVDPPMEDVSRSLAEMLADNFRKTVAGRVWPLFWQRQRENITIAAPVEDLTFWQSIREIAGRVGPEPVLLVSGRAEARFLRRFLVDDDATRPSLRVEYVQRERAAAPYIATVEGIDVYGTNFEPGSACLFSTRSLRAVRYGALDDSGRCVELTFEPVDQTTGALRARYVLLPDWENYPVFEIHAHDPPSGDDDD
jgi:hypothetical protein